jgi:hypothetical protein
MKNYWPRIAANQEIELGASSLYSRLPSPGTSVAHPNKRVDNPESMTFVIDNGRVAAMTVSIDLGGEF